MNQGRAVTIGFFDGVHRGHRYLLQQLDNLAAARGVTATAVTFDCHPRTIVQQGFIPSLLTTQEEKLKLIAEVFHGEIIVLPFTHELSAMTAKKFMRTVLRDKLSTEVLLMGYNHRFGHGGGTHEEYMAWGKEMGIDVFVAAPLNSEKVSSSRIRELISKGDIEGANAMLGYPYFLRGNVIEGKRIGRSIGFPTANISTSEEKLLPACGVYAVGVRLPDGTRHGGMLCIGHRPTIEKNGEISVEVHIFDFDKNLYGESIFIDFIEKLRDEQHFNSLDELRNQLTFDAKSAREIASRSA